MSTGDLVELASGDLECAQRGLEDLEALGGAGAKIRRGFKDFVLEVHESSCAASQQ